MKKIISMLLLLTMLLGNVGLLAACDEHTALDGVTHTHVWGDEGFVITPATHISAGIKTFTCECGETKIEAIPKLEDHVWNDGIITTEATHTKDGVKTFSCECGELKTEIIPKFTEHVWSEGVVTTPATHTAEGVMSFICECGETKTEPVAKLTDHVWDDGVVTTEPTHTTEGVKTFSCACGETKTEPVAKLTDHVWNDGVITTEPTHYVEGVKTFTCECGETKTEAIAKLTDHIWSSGVVTTEPTHTTEGVKTFTCACGETKTEPVAKLTDHVWDDGVVTTEPTHTTEGVKTFSCACGATKTEPVAKLTDHVWNGGVITTEPTHYAEGVKTFTCECGETKTEAVAKLSDHVWIGGIITTEPTHTTEGVKTFTCACGETKTEVVAKLTEHVWDDGVVTTEPTHTTEGVKTFSCACGETKTEAVAKLTDHVWGDGVVTTEPTHLTEGVKTFTCACGETKTETIAKLTDHEYGSWGKHNATEHISFCPCGAVKYAAHEWNDGVVTTEPTHYAEGVKTFICACGETKTEAIAKLTDHVWGSGVITTEPTHTTEGVKTFTCACGETKTEVVAKLTEHVWDDGVVTTEPTHTTEGVKTFSCACGETKTEPVAKLTEHVWDDGVVTTEPTHTTEGVKTFTCVCGETKTEPVAKLTDHVWNDGVITTEPTHTTEGVKTFSCACGETKTEAIAKLTGHEYGSWGKHNATEHVSFCSCGAVRYAAHEWNDGVVTTEPTHFTEGVKTFTCVCGETKTESVAKLPDHIWDTGVVTAEPTHLTEGVRTFSCACGETKTEPIAKLPGHTFDDGVVTTEPTHTTEGVKTYTCECGETKTEPIATTPGHTFDEGVITTEPTHTSSGVKTYSCECGTKIIEAVKKTPHVWDDGTITTAPTHNATGVKTFTCECGQTSIAILEKTPHEWGEGVITTPPTNVSEGIKTFTCMCGETKIEVVPALTDEPDESDPSADKWETLTGELGLHVYAGKPMNVSPVVDGVISEGEYSFSRVMPLEELYGYETGEIQSDLEEFIAHDANYIYIGARFVQENDNRAYWIQWHPTNTFDIYRDNSDLSKYYYNRIAAGLRYQTDGSITVSPNLTWNNDYGAPLPTIGQNGDEEYYYAATKDENNVKTYEVRIAKSYIAEISGCAVDEVRVIPYWTYFHANICHGAPFTVDAAIAISEADFTTFVPSDRTTYWFLVLDEESESHTWDEGTVTTEPTHATIGVKTFTCECGAARIEAIDKLPHEWNDGVVTTPATHTTYGIKTFTCECGKTKVEIISPIPHEWGEGVVTTEPTQLSKGVKTFTCECGETKIEFINKLPGGDPEVGLPTNSSLPDADWGGEECLVLGHAAQGTPQFENLEIWREDAADDIIGRAVWERNKYLKDTYNFEVKQRLVRSVKEEMNPLLASGEDLYDICIYRPFDAARHASEGCLLDLSTIDYIDLEHPSWDQNVTEQLAVGGKVFFTTSDFLLQDKDRTEVIFYNREMARQANKGYLEDNVKNGTWTVEYFGGLVKEFSTDGNGNHQLGDYKADGTGDYFGLGLPSYDSLATFAFGAGIKLSELDEDGYITIVNAQEHSSNIIDALGAFLFQPTQSFFVTDMPTYHNLDIYYKAHQELFAWEKMMFCSDVLSSLDRIHEGATMSEMIDFEYSFLPHPKYASGMNTWYTSTPSYTTGAVVAIPITVADQERSGFFLQALSEASTSTSLFAFYEQKCKIQNSQDDLAYEMLDIIFDNVRYDIAAMYDFGRLYTMLSQIGQIKRNNFDTAFQQRYEAARSAADAIMDEFA